MDVKRAKAYGKGAPPVNTRKRKLNSGEIPQSKPSRWALPYSLITNGNASFSHFLKCEGFNWGRIWLHVYTDVPYVFGPINPAIDDVVRNPIV